MHATGECEGEEESQGPGEEERAEGEGVVVECCADEEAAIEE